MGTRSDLFFYPLEFDLMYAGGLNLNSQTGKFILSRPGGTVQKRSPMSILIVSTNLLFKEVITATVAQFQTELIELSPGEALTRICELKPDVIIIDETLTPSCFEGLLAEARCLQKTRIIVLNPIQNEIILLDSRRATLRKADDLIEAISSYEHETQSEIDDRKIADLTDTDNNIAGIIAFVASAFKKPPDTNQVTMLRVIGVDAFVGLDRVFGWNDEISYGAREISEFIETTASLSEERAVQILDADWSGLFGTARAANLPAPYEALYLETETDPVELFGRLAIEYAEGGAEISDEEGVRLDSIGIELSYLSCLAEQIAAARERGDHELAYSLEGRVRKFYQDHLGKWAGGYLSTALKHAQTSYFKGFIRLSWGVISRLGDLGRPYSIPKGMKVH
jgi:TorA maturation chaperone TorD